MSVRRIEGGKDKGISAENVYVEEVNGKKVYVAVLSKQSLEADIQSLAAHFNGKMGRARFLEANNGQVSSISAKTVELMHTAWAKAQLMMMSGSQSVACSISDKLCDYVSTVFNIWRGDLDEERSKQAENRQLVGKIANLSPAQINDGPSRFQSVAYKTGEAMKDMPLMTQQWLMPQRSETINMLKEEDRTQQSQYHSR